jgi:UDP-N-acetylmuramyl tripeptide synthase
VPPPRQAFDDSRRLTGANRWYAGPAVLLTPLGPRADDAAAWARWSERVREGCAALGWADPAPQVHHHATGVFLLLAAPADALFTATELNEWAWEGVAGPEFDRAHDLPDTAAAHAAFARRAAQEASRPLRVLRAAANARGLPLFEDDESVSIGAGRGSAIWPRVALPSPYTVPWSRLHDIPKALVTGSNGKTTTVRLLAAMAAAAGHTPGLCSTEGVNVGAETVSSGDYSGPAGARAVLRHPGVTLAVLETARGGIARRGLAVSHAEVAVVTNVSADHFGEYGVDNEDDLAELKLVVAHAVAPRGLLVLNADDAAVTAAAQRLAHVRAARTAWFGADHAVEPLKAHRDCGGSTCGLAGDGHSGHLLLAHAGIEHDLGPVAALPLALGGAAAYNVMNMAGAALAAVAGLGLPVDAVRSVLQAFGSRPSDNPGRLECWSSHGATVLIDYAHNPDGLAQLLAVARALPHRRLLLLLGQAGNRDDAAIAQLARCAAAATPQHVVIKELRAMLRGRPEGQVPELLRAGLLQAGLGPQHIEFGGDEADAAIALLDQAGDGDLVVMPLHEQASRATVMPRLQPATDTPCPGPC